MRGVSDARMNINGVSNQATSQSVTAADGAYNMAAYQEMAVDTGGSGAEYSQGGLRMNMIPRDGGNVFRGYFLASYASDSLQSDNLNDDLIARGLSAPDKIKRLWDINPAFGGPIKRDKVWFHTTMRLTGAATYASLFFNKNAGNPNEWAYEPDTSREAAFNDHTIRNANVRVTWQATQKHKLAVSVDPSRICDCPRGLIATTAPEAFMMNYVTNQPKVFLFGDWTAPLTNRLLLDSAFVRHWSFTQRPAENLLLGGAQNMVTVTRAVEQPALPRVVHGASNAERHAVLARFGVVHHRRAQLQSGLQLRLGAAGSHRLLPGRADPVPLQQPGAQPADAACAALPQHHAHPRSRDLRAGSLDRQPADRDRRPALRLLPRLLPGDADRTLGIRAQPEPRVPEDRRRAVARPAAARRGRLRRLRRRAGRRSRPA